MAVAANATTNATVTSAGIRCRREIRPRPIGERFEYARIGFLLASFGALDGVALTVSPDCYAFLDVTTDGERAELLVEVFQRVDTGTIFAEADGTRLIGNWPFYPVLFGECGTDGILGCRGTPSDNRPS
jgi:hypothetical protein